MALRDFSFITILIRAGLSLNPKGLMLMKSVVIRLALCPGQLSTTTTTTIDRFKKFARLGTSLLISDAIILISATMPGKRTSDDLAKSIYRFQDANPDYANSAIARIFSISESTLRGILKRRIGQKKVKVGQKSELTRGIKRQLLGRVNRNSKFRLSDLLLTALKATAHPYF